MGTSSYLGPLFPHGFEDNIPTHFKTAQEEKRRKKLEKKKKLKLLAANIRNPPTPSQAGDIGFFICVDDIIEMAGTLAITFNGLTSELRIRIEKVLLGQKHDWEGQNQ